MKVAVLSPSAQSASLFPQVFDLGLERMRELGLEPVEFPTTRASVASPAERARDIVAAFADPSIEAIVAAIGGDDQLKVLPHLDADVLRANPKPFFGYSDNTNLHIYLWNLGIPSVHGGSVMVQFGRPSGMHALFRESFERALLGGEWELPQPEEYGDEEASSWLDFDPNAIPPMRPAEPWSWHGAPGSVTGRTWGGNLEILDFHLRAARWLQPNETYAGCVFLAETSEELPDADYVYRVLMCMGERGLLQQFAGVLWARPKATRFSAPRTLEERDAYVAAQREAVLRALGEYAPDTPIVFGVDFGHTDPQLVLPYGGVVTLDGAARRITVDY
jgi:muramoyltetrapeptide carboxypeptidase LdcA involved in peptidoglycan recycling